MPNETTTKFRVDISELKANIKEANRQIALANSQFKEASAGMDDWRQSTDGLSAKLKQLDTVTTQYRSILNELEKQYNQVVAEQGENSAGAVELEIKMNKLKATIKNNEAAMSNYENSLGEVRQAEEKAAKSGKEVSEVLEEMRDDAENAGDGFTIMKGAIASLIADGLKALATAVKDTMQEMILETGAAYDSFQAKTGVATESMGEFEDAINNIYKNNFGETLDDIATSMAEVKQQTGEIDPSKLQQMTENALTLRDTFDFEVGESMRAVNMLMDQFGISSDEAFNLVVQGAQKGLNKNGDLLDVINEYSVHYKQMGYDADDFFNSLVNGTEAGTFSVDKLGDAMKEFGIRTKDTAKSTTEGFELVGLNADEMRKAFNKGGDEAQKATQKTLKALFEMDDEVKQNQAGVALFGTMWEDLGVEGVKALMDTNGELDKTKAAMKEVAETKYDNVAAKFSQIGRTVQMDLLLPLAEKLLPTIEKVANYAIENSDKVVSALKTVGITLGAVFVTNKIATFVSSLVTMVSTFTKVKTAIQAADTAQKALNLTQLASPWGIVALAIGAVVTGVVAYTAASKNAADATTKEYKEIDEFNKKVREQAQAYREAEAARSETIDGIQSEYNHYSDLVDELENITDENGKVKEGYEARAQVITGILSDALGEEISTDKLVADGKQKVIDKINELIVAKKNEAMLEAYKSDYLTALKEKDGAIAAVTEAQKNYNDAVEKVAAAEKEMEAASKSGSNTIAGGAGAYAAAASKVAKLKEKQKECSDELLNAQDTYEGYMSTIQNYDGVSAAIIEGDTAKISEAILLLTNNFVTAENGTKASLEAQVQNAKTNLADLKAALAEGMPGVTQQMVTDAQTLVTKAEAELNKLAPKGEDAGENAGEKTASGMSSKTDKVIKSAADLCSAAKLELDKTPAKAKTAGEKTASENASGMDAKSNNVIKSAKDLAGLSIDELEKAPAKAKTAGEDVGDENAAGMKSKSGEVEKAGKTLGDSGVTGFGSKNAAFKTEGSKLGGSGVTGLGTKKGAFKTAAGTFGKSGADGLGAKTGDFKNAGGKLGESGAAGIKAKGNDAKKSGESVGGKGKQGLESVKADSSGKNFVQGFINGMGSLGQSLWSKAWSIGKQALNAVRSAIGEASPAKETIESGKNFDRGLVVGMHEEKDAVISAATDVGESAVAALDESLDTTGIQAQISGISGEAKKEDENKAKAFDNEHAELKRKLDFGIISEAEYYTELGKLRDKHLTTSSDKWIDATKEIYDYRNDAQKESDDKAEKSAKNAQTSELNALKRRLARGEISEKQYYDELAKYRDKYFAEGSEDWYALDDEIYNYTQNQAKQAQQKELDDLKRKFQRGYITEKEYYDELAKLRDKYYAEGSADWQALDDEIYNGLINTKNRVKTVFDQIRNDAVQTFEAIEGKQSAFGDALNDFSPFKTITFIEGDKTETFQKLNDFDDELEQADKYAVALQKAAQRILKSGADEEVTDFLLKKIESLGNSAEALQYLGLINDATDEDFNKWLGTMDKLMDTNAQSAGNFYAGEMWDALVGTFNNLATTLAESDGDIPTAFFESGAFSAEQFAAAFVEGMDGEFPGISEFLKSYFDSLASQVGEMIAPTIGATITAGLPTSAESAGGGTVNNSTSNTTVINNNFEQVINSPEPVKRIDVYRNTNNLLNLSGGVNA